MRILLASSSSGSRGGGELFLLYLASGLKKRGHEVVLWASANARMDELAAAFMGMGQVLRSPYINTYDRPLRVVPWLGKSAAHKIVRQWESARPDLIQYNKQNLEDGLDLLASLGRSKIPNLCTIHITQSPSVLGARLGRWRDFVSRRALRAYRGPLVAVQPKRADDLSAFLSQSANVHSIPNGVPLPNLLRAQELRILQRKTLGLNDADLLVLAVGRMTEHKRPLLFLQMAAEALSQGAHCRFVWAGDGPLTGAWDDFVAKAGLTSSIQRVSWQSDIAPYLAAADLFLHVAHIEGLPLALLEAMAMGLPCAVTQNLALDLPLIPAGNLIVVRHTRDLLSALSDRDRLKTLGAKVRLLVESEFSTDQMAAGYEELYQRILQ